MRFDCDLFVLGGGSGGVRAARIAASHGARVVIAEDRRWGGTCVVRGCVPKKLLVYASEVRAQIEDARGFGWTIEGAPDWPALVAAKDREVARLSQAYADTLRRHGAEIVEGRAVVADPHTVEVGGRRVTAANILIATGGRPRRPVFVGGELAISSDEAFDLPALPRRVLLLGGGYIAVEFAHIFAGLGSQVVLAHRAERVLSHFDDDVRTQVDLGLARKGVDVRGGTELVALDGEPGALRGHLGAGAAIEADVVMAAIGRDPATAGLGLAEIGVLLDARGAVVVDEWSRSNVRHVYAVGDVTARVALTPVAIREGHAFADTVFGGRPTPIVHDLVATAVFAQPPAAAIGLTEAAARARGIDVAVYRSLFRPLRHTVSGRDERTLVKLVVDAATRRVIGLHMVGADAPEIVQGAAIAITLGATKEDFDRTFAIHPTSAEELVLLRG